MDRRVGTMRESIRPSTAGALCYTRGMAFSAVETLKTGWSLFKRRPGFFIAVSLGFGVVFWVLGEFTDDKQAHGLMRFLLTIASFVIGVVIEMFLINFALAAHDHPETVELSEGKVRMPFWQYAAAKIAVAIVVVTGFFLLIIPGVFALLALMFTNYLVVDKNLTFIDAMKESYRITRPHWLELFLLLVMLIGINIIGALFLFVGLLVSVPVSMLAMAHAYRTLSNQTHTTPIPTVVETLMNPFWIMLSGFLFAIAPIVLSVIADLTQENAYTDGSGMVFLLAFATVPIGGVVILLGAIKAVWDYLHKK